MDIPLYQYRLYCLYISDWRTVWSGIDRAVQTVQHREQCGAVQTELYRQFRLESSVELYSQSCTDISVAEQCGAALSSTKQYNPDLSAQQIKRVHFIKSSAFRNADQSTKGRGEHFNCRTEPLWGQSTAIRCAGQSPYRCREQHF